LKAKSGLSSDPLADIPDFITPPKIPTLAQNPQVVALTPQKAIQLQSLTGPKSKSGPAVSKPLGSQELLHAAGSKSPHSKSATLVQSKSPSDQTKNSAQSNVSNPTPPLQSDTANPPPAITQSNDGNSTTSGSNTTPADATIVSNKISTVMPSFQVNDDSKIDIMACEHEFETSMARNDFSSQSTEASL